MHTHYDDPLALGQRIATLLESGRRVSTYKLATLMALLDHCVEHLPEEPMAAASVSIHALSQRVIELYWAQGRPYLDRGRLRQNEQEGHGIPGVVEDLRLRAHARGLRTAGVVAERAPELMRGAVRRVSVILAQQPLTALQTLERSAASRTPPFLFDDSWLSKKVRATVLDDHGWRITLFPGVAHSLARLAGLLRPVIQLLWVQDVARLNQCALEGDDLATFLFGADRVALAPVAEALWELQQERCFYCGRRIPRDGLHIDHVLPFARSTFDGLANLVAVASDCNLSKSDSLPALGHVRRVLTRPLASLDAISISARWPVAYARFRATARGLYLASPSGTPLWHAARGFEALDVVQARLTFDEVTAPAVDRSSTILAADR